MEDGLTPLRPADPITEIKTVMGKVRDDAEQDAGSRDGQPLTGLAVGEMHGVTMAMIAALATSVHMLASELARLRTAAEQGTKAFDVISTLLDAVPGDAPVDGGQ